MIKLEAKYSWEAIAIIQLRNHVSPNSSYNEDGEEIRSLRYASEMETQDFGCQSFISNGARWLKKDDSWILLGHPARWGTVWWEVILERRNSGGDGGWFNWGFAEGEVWGV